MLFITGASKNHVRPFSELKGIVPVPKLFLVQSVHGNSAENEKCKIELFVIRSNFFI